MPLTQEEQEQLKVWLDTQSIVNMPIERPVVPSVALLDNSGVEVQLGADVRLSELSRKEQQKRINKALQKKAGRQRNKQALPRGRRHHKRKEATKRRNALKRWETQPYKSCVYGYGVWDISEEEWNYFLQPFWEKGLEAKHLHIKRTWGKGTKKEPYTIWDVRLYYKEELLWHGPDERVFYVLSQPNELDRALSHEGEELFTTSYSLDGNKLEYYTWIRMLNRMYNISS